MRILVTLDYYHPHWTGLTAYAKRLAEGLVARGHIVTVLTSQHNSDLPRSEQINGVQVIRLPVAARISRGVLMPTFPVILARLLSHHDLLHIHTPMPEALIGTLLARAMKKPSLVTHQGDVVMPAGRLNAIVQQGVGLLKMGMRFADYIVVHSDDYARHSSFLSPFMNKLGAIYPPVELPQPIPSQVAAYRRSLGLEDKQIVGFAGRFVEEKGFDILLQSIPHVVGKASNAHFVYAGETHVRYENFYAQCIPLIEKSKNNLTFCGLLHEPQKLANFYGMCDVFVIPSRTDCFPSVQLEALLSGVPLVTTDIPGAREAIQVTKMGHLVPSNDSFALSDGIVMLLNNRAKYKPERIHIESIFGAERSLDNYESLMYLLTSSYPPHIPETISNSK